MLETWLRKRVYRLSKGQVLYKIETLSVTTVYSLSVTCQHLFTLCCNSFQSLKHLH